jgi:non-heme chloroperoxidase
VRAAIRFEVSSATRHVVPDGHHITKDDGLKIEFRGSRGINLVADAFGDRKSQPVLLLHGGGQTRHSWGTGAAALAANGFFAIALDARGHGSSQWAQDADYSIDAFADDLRAVGAQLTGPPAIVGASLGGLTSMIALGEDPRLATRALLLVDVVPRMSRDGRERILAFMGEYPNGFSSVEAAAAAVSAFLPHRAPPADLAGLEKNLRRDAFGRHHWHWDPAFLDSRAVASASDADRFERALARIDVPIVLIRGRSSDVVTSREVETFRRIAPQARVIEILGAAHMVAGDQNDAFAAAVLDVMDGPLSR